ncbi:hypothetical protein [Bacillus toyonensis]|nr:hypothetical protein [Bacillus toyonensis]
MDEAAKFAHAEEQGIKKGIEKGIEEGKKAERIQLVCGMYKNGMSVEDIAKFTKLPIEEIREIIQL